MVGHSAQKHKDTRRGQGSNDDKYHHPQEKIKEIERQKMKKYKEKPKTYEALQLNWDTWDEMRKFLNVGELKNYRPEAYMVKNKLGVHVPRLSRGERSEFDDAQEGDWILKDPNGIFSVCKAEVFNLLYEAIDG